MEINVWDKKTWKEWSPEEEKGTPHVARFPGCMGLPLFPLGVPFRHVLDSEALS
jgi:hypothetical protein